MTRPEIQDRVTDIIQKAVNSLPDGASKEALREAITEALTQDAQLAPYVSIVEEPSYEAGFKVRIDFTKPTDFN